MSKAIVAVCLLCLAWIALPAAAVDTGPPNIFLVLSDDQRWDTIAEMGRVQSDLVAKGVNFTNAHQTTPLCCPSRSSILTGQYAHTHGVWRNNPPYGFAALDDSQTIATLLQDAGYRTGLFGKYLNGYPEDGTDPLYIPPGWDEWKAIMTERAAWTYYDYSLNENGMQVGYGHQPQDYVTDVLFDHAGDFIDQAVADDVPFFAYVAQVAPHTRAVPEADYEHAYDNIPIWRPASYNEHDVSDKPAYIQQLPKLTPSQRANTDDYRERQYETLQSVDEDLGQILDRLPPEELANTLVIYTSDNGDLWGEHRLTGKNLPYQEALRAPLAMRWDNANFTIGDNGELAANIDLAPTIYHAAVDDATMPGADGSSLLPTARTGVALRDHHVIEGASISGFQAHPSWCGIQWEHSTYVRYATGEEEFYKLTVDPLQRGNRAPAMEANGTLAKWRQVAQAECVPTPPKFSW